MLSVSCALEGGLVEKVGMLQSLSCVHYYSDVGKSCSDGSQCKGDCVVEVKRTWIGHTDKGESMEMESLPSRPHRFRSFTGKAARSFACERNDNPFGCRSVVKNGKVVSSMCLD